jgi:hypothetical protein
MRGLCEELLRMGRKSLARMRLLFYDDWVELNFLANRSGVENPGGFAKNART